MNPFTLLTEGIWRDEAFSYLLAKRSFIEIISITVRDFNPPLYYFLLHTWMQLFGTSEISMRSMSLLFYVLGVFATYEIFKVILNKSHKETVILTLICALNPLVFYYAFEARMYSMLFCLTMASSYYFLKKDWRNYTILAVIGMYTHYFMALVIIVQFAISVTPLVRQRWNLNRTWNILKPFILTGLCFLPWALYFLLHNSSASEQGWIVPLKLSEILLLPGLTYSGIEKDFAAGLSTTPFYLQLLRAFTILFFACVIGGFYVFKHRKHEFSIFLYFVLLTVVPSLLILATMALKPLYVPRYFIFVSAAISMIIVFVLASLKRPYSYAALLVFFLLTVQFQQIQLKHRSRQTTKEIVDKIKTQAADNDVIYVQSTLDLMATQYYFDPKRVFLYGEKYEDIPSYVGKVLIPPDTVATSYPPFPVKAFVLTGNSSYEIHSEFR